jgi:xylulokinase
MAGDVLLAGVDIGTTNLKAVIFDASGGIVARASASTPTHYPRPGWAYYEPEELWQSTLDVLRAAVAQVDHPERIVSVACASIGETAVPIDNDGRPTSHAIAWFDQRTEQQAKELAERIGSDRVIQVSGLDIHPMFGLCKLMWLHDHEPDAYDRTVTWVNIADYIAFRLSGVAATDYSLASRTLALDLHRLCWDTDLIRDVGIKPYLFPNLAASGTWLGVVLPDVAAATGLPATATVAVGGHDHVCGALALGVIAPGTVLDSMGSSEAIFLPIEHLIADPNISRMGYTQGAHVVGGYYVLGGQFTSGAAIEWFRHALAEHTDYDSLIEEAQRVPPGSLGVSFLPHLRTANAPHNDAKAMGAFVGLTTDAQRGTLFRALLEGTAFEMRGALEPLLQAAGALKTDHIIAAGGSTRNHLLMQIKADVFAKPIVVLGVEEATALGAAMLGGLAAGEYANTEEALKCLRFMSSTVSPDPAAISFYDHAYREIYQHLYRALKPIHHATRLLHQSKGLT